MAADADPQPSKLRRFAGACFTFCMFAAIAIGALALVEANGASRQTVDFYARMVAYMGPGAAIIGWRFPDTVLRPFSIFRHKG